MLPAISARGQVTNMSEETSEARITNNIKAEIQLKIHRGIAQRCIARYHDNLADLMKESKRLGREVGALFCMGEDGKCHIGKTCIGDVCSITLVDCGGRTQIGRFHTHPDAFGDPRLSVVDIINTYCTDEIFGCVGYPETGYMSCFLMVRVGEVVDKLISKGGDMETICIDEYPEIRRIAIDMREAGLWIPMKESEPIVQLIDESVSWVVMMNALLILRSLAKKSEKAEEFVQRLSASHCLDAIFDLTNYIERNHEKICVPLGPPVRLIDDTE